MSSKPNSPYADEVNELKKRAMNVRKPKMRNQNKQKKSNKR